MSTTVDSRVVEMRFDNKQFEANVQTSMSTLQKLKQSLNLTGASKGLENINTAVKNTNISSLGTAAETVGFKFNALWTIADQTMRNITNSVERTATNMVKALTLDPVKTGLSEYETKINAVQVIQANTRGKNNMNDITSALNELNEYADKTIYNFAQMTSNIGKFTAQGLDVYEASKAVQGLANLAAASGANAEDMSRATYQMSQALSGTIKLMDWNSLRNSNMATVELKNTLIDLAKVHGIAIDDMIKKEGTFEQTLSSGWLTGEMFTEAMNIYSGVYSEAELASMGFTESQIANFQDLAKMAESAATEVKTFTQLWDVLKETAQSGWTQTWELLIGDFDTAKKMWTNLQVYFSDIINGWSDARNNLLKGALGNPFKGLTDKIEKVTSGIDKIKGATEAVTKVTKDYEEVVNKVLGGEYGNGKARWDKLAEDGYDWAKVQNLVNKELGCSKRYTEQVDKSQKELSKTQKITIDDLIKMSDAQLKQIGFTKDEVKAFRELEKQSEKTGIPMEEILKNTDLLSGRSLLVNSFKNVWDGLVTVLTSVKDAFRDIFPPMTSDQLYNIIAGLHKLSTYLVISDENADKLKRTFKGVFAILDIATTILGGGIKVAFKALSTILGAFDMNVLDLTANIGDLIVKFRDWLFKNNAVIQTIDKFISKIPSAINGIKEWFKSMGENTAVKKLVYTVGEIIDLFSKLITLKPGTIEFDNVVSSIRTYFSMIPGEMVAIGRNIIEGLQNGIGGKINSIVSKITEVANTILTTIKAILGIHSPSTEMEEVGTNAVEGLINGLKNGIGKIGDVLKTIASSIIDVIGKIPWNKLFAGGIAIAIVWIVKKIADAIGGISSAFEGFGDLCESAGKTLKSFSKVLNGLSWDLKAKAIQKLAISLGILVAAVIALTFIEPGKLWNAVGVILALSVILGILAIAMDKMSQASIDIRGGKIEGLKSGLIQIGITLLLLAATVKLLGSMNITQAIQGFVGLTILMIELGAFLAAFAIMSKKGSTDNMDKLGSMMLKLSFSLLLMTGVVKLVSGLSVGEMVKGTLFAAAFAIFVRSITAVAKDSGNNVSKVGGMVLKLSIAMMLMVGVVKLASKLSVDEMLKGAAFAAGFLIFVKVLIKVADVGDEGKIGKIGGLVFGISFSLLLMVGVCKLIGFLKAEEIFKGVIFVSAFMIMVKALVKVATIGNDQQMAKVAGTILAMSVAIGIMAGVAILLSLIDVNGLTKGIIAVGLLGGVITAMIWATRGANDVKGNLIAMSIAIGVMTAAVIALSFIDANKLTGATVAISIMMGMFALIAKSAGTMGKVMGPLIVMTVAVGVLAGILYLLSRLEIGSTIEIAGSLSILLLALSAAMLLIGKAGNLAIKSLIPMAGLIVIAGMLGLMIAEVAKLNPDSTIQIAISLSVFLVAMSAVCLILSKIGSSAFAAVPAAIAVMAVIAVIGAIALAIGGLMSLIPQDRIEEWKTGLQSFMDFITILAGGLGEAIGSFVGGALEGLTSGLPGIGTNLSSFIENLDGFMAGAKNIGEDSLTGVKNLAEMLLLLTGASILDAIANIIPGYSGMEGFSSNLNTFGDAIVQFSNKVSGNINEDAVTAAANAGKILAKLQSTVSASGGVVQWFCGEKNLADFGTQLVAFGDAIVAFSNKVSGGINEEAVTAAASAGSIMAELQGKIASTGGVVQWFCGEKDFAAFGTQLVAFGSAIVAFSNKVSGGINEDAVTAAANAGTLMAELQNKIVPTGGVIQWFCGEKDFATFSTNIGLFGEAIGKLKEGMGESGISEEVVASVTNAGNALIALNDALPEEGFFDSKITMTDFSTYISDFSTAISDFSSKASEINSEGINTAINAAYRIKNLIDAVSGIDVSGVEKFTGVGSGGVGADGPISDIADAMVGFSSKVAGIDTTAVSTSVSAASRLKTLINSLVDLDNSGVEKFKVQPIGTAMKSYISSVEGMDTGVVSSSISAANRLKNFINGLADLDNSGIGKFKIGSIGDSIKDYALSVAGVDSGAISSSINGANKIKNFINSLASLDTSGVSSFNSAVSTLGQTNVDGLVSTFSGAASKMSGAGTNMMTSLAQGMKSSTSSLTTAASGSVTSIYNSITSKSQMFATAGKTLFTQLVAGINSMRGAVISASANTAASGTSGIRGYYYSFYSAGSYLVSGFCNGISANTFRAAAQARAMANAAERAAKEALNINSPSRVFAALGAGVVEGFVKGIDDNTSDTVTAVHNMADTAIQGFGDAMGTVMSVLNSDTDMQPTIRPVVDLSEVTYGANAINDMLAMGSSIGVNANVRTVSSMMANRNQNGANSEIVSAIDKLRKDLGNVGNTYNSINGVTYDDGSNINDAVQTLIRAAKVERRR